jgi:hypothetical protein
MTRNDYKILIGKMLGEQQFGRPRKRWDNMNMVLMEVGCVGVFWMKLDQHHVQW